jgi:hypothetical protein
MIGGAIVSELKKALLEGSLNLHKAITGKNTG